MPMMHTRRRFLDHSLTGRRHRLHARAPSAGRARSARNNDCPHCKARGHLHCSAVCRRGTAARGRVYRYPLCRCGGQPSNCRRSSDAAKWISRWTLPRGSSRRSMTAEPITVLGGVHVGCYELFAKEGIRSIGDLKGKSVGVKAGSRDTARPDGRSGRARPAKDIRWVTSTA